MTLPPKHPHPLYGVRLGRMERHLLSAAAHPERLFGYVLQDSDPSVREQLRRGARKLVDVGLLDLEKVRLYTRARDPRREGLLVVGDRFCRREDSSRAHLASRNVAWLSKFGSQIEVRYRAFLKSGAPIRWDAAVVNQAYYAAARHAVNLRPRALEVERREQEAREAVLFPDPHEQKLKVVRPPEVRNILELERWTLAVRVTRRREVAASPEELWELARKLYAEADLEGLRAMDGEHERPRITRAEQFRRRPLRQIY